MTRLCRLTLAAAALVALPALGQLQLKTPVPIVSPTPTPAPRGPTEYVPHTPKELPPTRTPVPTRTATPTPVPPDQRFAGPRWGTDQYLLPVKMTRLDAQSRCKSGGDFLNSGKVRLFVDCVFLGNGPLGLKADFEVAKGLHLKNGWKVKSFELHATDGTEPFPADSHHGFRITQTPAVGSDSPEFSVHLFAELTKGIYVEGGVLIEGPHGTTPW
jgi:hypothetical protein